MIVVTFAVPQESRGFRSELRSAGTDEQGFTLGNLGPLEVGVCHTGIGAAPARARIEKLLAMQAPSHLICAGFAGALDPCLHVSDAVGATNYSDGDMLARLRLAVPEVQTGILFSADHLLETAEEKSAVRDLTGAAVVDMETAAVHEVCTRAGIPMLGLRTISDTARDSLPVPLEKWFDQRRQKPHVIRLLLYLARHPLRIRPFARFVDGINRAERNLTLTLLRYLS